MDYELITDYSMLTLDDIYEEYKKLFYDYKQLNKLHENDLQQIYELKRNLKISKATEEHLTQELDIISTSQNFDIDKLNKKLNQDLEEFKRKTTDLEEYNDILEKKLEKLNSENIKLQDQLHKISISVKDENHFKENHLIFERQHKLESENLEFLCKLNELQEQIQKGFMTIAEKERQIEVLKEEIQFYQDSLNAKRIELDEKSSILDSLQERIMEMNAELASLSLQPQNENRKGNSLFAEVDDQRQVMKNQLLAQKKSFIEMKKVYSESQCEIRRLKRENSAMQTEIQACSSIFLNSKKYYEDKLVEKISFLSKRNDELEKKLNISEDRLISLAEKNEITWLDSMMAFCKNETKELKTQLHNIRLQKGIIEKNYRNSQEELARWRFEALKSRCIIIDRESLLDENTIKYKKINEINMNIKEEIPKSIPQILYTQKESIKQSEKTMSKVVNKLDFPVNPFCNAKNYRSTNQILTEKEIKCSTIVDLPYNIKLDTNEHDKKIKNTLNYPTMENNLAEDLKTDENIKVKCVSSSNDSCELHPIDSLKINEFQYKDKKNLVDKMSNKLESQNNENECISLNLSNKSKDCAPDNEMFETNTNLKTYKTNETVANHHSTIKVITKKTKSNITIKKIVIKSKENKN